MTFDVTAPMVNDLDAYWMPFTANRQFKGAPRLLVSARGMHYTSRDGRRILDGTAGLWCVNAGHGRPEITEAIRAMAGHLDYAPPFQMGHPLAFDLAARLVSIMPDGLDHVFFSNSGSEAVETALKIALAYHAVRGEAGRTRLIGRERAYHGVNFGGLSVGGMVNNRRLFGTLLGGVDHLPHTHLPAENAFTRGQPAHGAHLADDLERLVALHGAETIAAVIVEPMAGSAGVLPPPRGYLERLREITTRHGILLIFDEVITAFGRLGHASAAERFGVTPDIMTTAKALTNAAVPMGATLVSGAIHDAFMRGPEHVVELFHGYTYSAHPLACAAAVATQEVYKADGLFTRARTLEDPWADAIHGLRDLPHVIDLRTLGLVAAVELAPRPEAPGERGFEVFRACYDRGVLTRVTGDTIALSPPLIIGDGHIDQLVSTLADVLRAIP
ncbi:aspartate aminotransferase family protein [Roseospira visakhapatnamensis]|uniref:Beta-alanine--pyruvate transaminase n=1 Tax=Roseospira visakhapatnamensis TaxID=390880 RepID=A0A7W6W8M4_9PROT|nr:aspartate aminotransferase family protein [Roseospira visakhapatnamensis]MBB4264542.1 beta-alanine--pyruvate transaminase [Roseospira visakhapatnamensis]